MEKGESHNVFKVYDKIASWYAKHRDVGLIEKNYLDRVIDFLPNECKVLDLGCGTGKPILEYLQRKSINVTGVDASGKMLEIARSSFPMTEFILQDMRHLNLGKRFDAIIAWHSFFHLPVADQPAMFKVFQEHLNCNGILLFTSGYEQGETWGINGGENLFHASLDQKEYKDLLIKHNFEILDCVRRDPDCGYATIWMAQYSFVTNLI